MTSQLALAHRYVDGVDDADLTYCHEHRTWCNDLGPVTPEYVLGDIIEQTHADGDAKHFHGVLELVQAILAGVEGCQCPERFRMWIITRAAKEAGTR